MKVLSSLLVVLAMSIGTAKPTENMISATYDGLSENMEFQFTDDAGEVYLFLEIEEDIPYNLFEEDLVGQKFKVTWEERETEVIDDENDEVSIQKVKVITKLEKL